MRTATTSSLLARALALPESWEDHPWEECVVKVGKKIFLFLGAGEGRPPAATVKLPDSAEEALTFEGAAPSGYGLGRAGWVTVPLSSAPAGLFEDWIEESYRAVAPKRLARLIDEDREVTAPNG